MLSDVDAVVDDSAELFTTGFSTTTTAAAAFGFGGLPFGRGGGFVLAAGGLGFFVFTSSSDSVVLSGEKMLFSFESTVFEFVDAFCVTFAAAPLLFTKFLLFKFCSCCCCCFTTAGGALPPVTGTAFAFDLFGSTGFFFVSFGTRFGAVWFFDGCGASSSLE